MAEIIRLAPMLELSDMEDRLTRALVARYGLDQGTEAAAEAMAWGWANRDKLEAAANPLGLLFRVGQSKSRRFFRWRRDQVRFPAERRDDRQPWVEPGLDVALAKLEIERRTAVVLVHCFEWTYPEVAELLEVPLHTVRNQVHRGLKELRRELGVGDDD